MRRKIVLFLFLYPVLSHGVYAQRPRDKPDSTKIYRDIEEFSKKRKSTNFIYRLFFRPITIPPTEKSNNIEIVKLQEFYNKFEGKIIREIHITTLDPFGNSITDTTATTQNILDEAGNRLHFKTQRITIQNLLLIRKNELFDSLLVKESERLIRAQKYVHEVSLSVVSSGEQSDSVDIFIRELDIWSIIPEGSVSTSSFNVTITDKNFLGFGHEFKNSYARNFTNGNSTFNTNYVISNIRNTYISSTLHYGVDGYGNYNNSLNIDRPFFSPFAKWAAGISLYSQFKSDSLKDVNLVNVPYNLSSGSQDYWIGNAHGFLKGNTEKARVTRLILGLRYMRTRYFEKPPELYDTLHTYSNEDFYLGEIGISTRKYVQDKYVFNYGVVEDVPVGRVYGLTGGYQVRNNIGRVYLGVLCSIGNYNDWGYISWAIEYGSFYRTSQPEQSVFTAGINYFTDLFAIGNWKFRQFAKPQLTLGLNRLVGETININNENGIRGFNSIIVTGTKKIALTLQTQSYAPWSLLGFKFGPYLIYSLGMLGDEASGFTRSRIYSEFALGVLLKNQYLVFDYFQLSISFYPIIPGDGENIFKINPTSTTDFGFRDFIIGKPATVAYQ